MGRDYPNHDDYYASFLSERVLSPLVAVYLASSYAYYQLNSSVLSDGFFDQIAQTLLKEYDAVTHIHKGLITKGDLEAGTLLLSESKYPSRAKYMARFLIDQLRYETRKHSSVFVCPYCGVLFSWCGWAEDRPGADTDPMPCCSLKCQANLATRLLTMHENHVLKRRLSRGTANHLFTAIPSVYSQDKYAAYLVRFHGGPVAAISDIPTVGFIGEIPDHRIPEMRALARELFQAPFSYFFGIGREP